MTNEELIAKQQHEIEEYKAALKENEKVVKKIQNSFYAIGQPLNDNILRFNKEQIKWALEVVALTEQIKYITTFE